MNAKRNIRLIMYLNFSWMFLIVQAIMVPFYRSKGLSFEQIYLVSSTFSIVLLLLDMPTGYVADQFGRKGSLVFAGLFKGLGGLTLFLWPHFYGFIFAYVLIGIGNSLFSGADVALLYDYNESLGDKKIKDSDLLADRFLYGQVGVALSSIIGSLLAHLSLDLTIAMNAIVAWLSFILAFLLQSIKTTNVSPKVNHLREFCLAVSQLLRSSSRLRLLIANRVFFLAISLLQLGQLQVLWTALNIPILWFGFLWAIHGIAAAYFSKKAAQLETRLGYNLILTLVLCLPAAGYLGSALALKLGAVGICFALLFELNRGLMTSVLNAEFNRLVSSNNRALGNSLVSMGSRLGYVVVAPLAGLLIDRGGLGILFILSGFLSFVIGWLLTRRLFVPNAINYR